MTHPLWGIAQMVWTVSSVESVKSTARRVSAPPGRRMRAQMAFCAASAARVPCRRATTITAIASVVGAGAVRGRFPAKVI